MHPTRELVKALLTSWGMAMNGRFEQLMAGFQAALRRTAKLKVKLNMAAGLYPPGMVPHDNLIEDAAQTVAGPGARARQRAEPGRERVRRRPHPLPRTGPRTWRGTAGGKPRPRA
jgi:hypothetical protein